MTFFTKALSAGALVLLLGFSFNIVEAYTLRYDGEQVPLFWDGIHFKTTDSLSSWSAPYGDIQPFHFPANTSSNFPSGACGTGTCTSPRPFTASDLINNNVTFDNFPYYYNLIQNLDPSACDGVGLTCHATISSSAWDTSMFPDVVIHGAYMLFDLTSNAITAISNVVTVPEKSIISFNFENLDPIVAGIVDEVNHTVNITVPYGTDVSSLVPTISISDGASVTPASGVSQDFTDPVIYTVTASDRSTQSYTVTVTPSCVTDCFSNVLFLPGLEASRLYQQKTILGLPVEDQLWEPSSFLDVPDLYLNSDGTSKNLNIYTKDIIDTASAFGIFHSDIYRSLISELNNLHSTHKIDNWKGYAYDWRQGVDDLIQNGTRYDNDQVLTLIGTLQSLVNTSKTGNVTIISHSNGGLLAKALVKKLEDMKINGQGNLIDHIDVVVMVASPQLGTPDAVSAILHGYKKSLGGGALLTSVQARLLAHNMSSAYGLLPSQKYFDQNDSSPIAVFKPTAPSMYKNNYGVDLNNYQEERNFVLGTEGRMQPDDSDLISPSKANDALLAQAETLHDLIDNLVFPSSIKVINVAGWGKATISGMTYDGNDIQPIYTNKGDETVVMQSALYGQGDNYWIDLSNSKLNHGTILEDQRLLNFIKNIIQKENISPDISSSEPVQIDNLAYIGVHSPVSIGVYDNEGNFTGQVCDDSTDSCIIKEDIPGSTYFNFGEGKYVNLRQSKIKKVVLQGIGIGTFTYNSEKVLPNGTSTTSSFVDIPVTTQTQAEVTLNQSGIPQLKLDVTGDGVTDFTLNPSETFDPVKYLQVMKATIDSLDLTKEQKKNFDSKVDNIIKLIQKGKIDKAKLKADKFKSALEKKLAKPDPKHPKPKKLSKTDAQLLLDMLNKLLDNLN